MFSWFSTLFRARSRTAVIVNAHEFERALERVVPVLVKRRVLRSGRARALAAFFYAARQRPQRLITVPDRPFPRWYLSLDDSLVLRLEPLSGFKAAYATDVELPEESRALHELAAGRISAQEVGSTVELLFVGDKKRPVAVPCHVCDGRGSVRCRRCDGRGWYRSKRGKRRQCKADGCRRGRRRCYYCHGDARAECGVRIDERRVIVRLPKAREERIPTRIYVGSRAIPAGKNELLPAQARQQPPLTAYTGSSRTYEALAAAESQFERQLREMEEFLQLELEAAASDSAEAAVHAGRAERDASGKMLLVYSVAPDVHFTPGERLLLVGESRTSLPVVVHDSAPGKVRLIPGPNARAKPPRSGTLSVDQSDRIISVQRDAVHYWRETETLRSPIKKALCIPDLTTEADPGEALKLFNTAIADNPAQLRALETALSGAHPLYCIQGPPGTGKSSVIVELIRQELARGARRILVTSQSNFAVDNVLERLIELPEISVLRVGAEERVHPAIAHLLPEQLLPELRAEPQTLFARLKRLLFSRGAAQSDAALVAEQVQVVGATCIGSASALLRRAEAYDRSDWFFDLIIVDEAGRSTPMETLVPLQYAPRAVLVGDHKQLPPMISSPLRALWQQVKHSDIEESVGAQSLFETIINRGTECAILTRQYRMHPQVGSFVAEVFYPGERLENGVRAEERAFPLPGFPDALSYHPTAPFGERRYEQRSKSSSSRENGAEAELTARLLRLLDQNTDGARPSVGVITFYSGQVELLRKLLQREQFPSLAFNPDEDVATLDSFQGREKDIILLSLVRSPRVVDSADALWYRFFLDMRRLNVALSRARMRLLIIGDIEQILRITRNRAELPGFEVFERLHRYLAEHALTVSTDALLKGTLPAQEL